MIFAEAKEILDEVVFGSIEDVLNDTASLLTLRRDPVPNIPKNSQGTVGAETPNRAPRTFCETAVRNQKRNNLVLSNDESFSLRRRLSRRGGNLKKGSNQ